MCLLATAACAHGVARLIHRDQTGGVIELGSGRDDGDRAAAEKLMIEHCGPGGGEVVSEGEETIGAHVRMFRVREDTAWRIHYQCRAR